MLGRTVKLFCGYVGLVDVAVAGELVILGSGEVVEYSAVQCERNECNKCCVV